MRLCGVGAAGATLLGTAGCGGGAAGGQGMAIAYQPGIGYAQLLIMKQERWLEEELPDMEVSYRQLNSGAAIRDGMLSGDIQVGSGGVGPFLVGFDSGVDWRLLTGLNQMDLWLMAVDERLQSLEDFEGSDRIAMPGPDSIQSIVLRKGAEEQLGDARALDNNIVSQGHPEAQQALLSGQLAGHLTSPPFQFTEQDEGAHIVLRSFDLFGPHTFNSVFVRQDYYDENSEAMNVLYENVQRASELIENDPDGAAEILSAETGGDTPPEAFRKSITEENVSYATEPKGLLQFAEFMQQIGLINEVPGSCGDLVFENLGSTESC